METRKILVVDDEYLVLHALSYALQGEGVEVSTVETAEEALARIGDEFFDLCFLDRRLPGLDGLDALQQIKAESPATRVVFMTATCLTVEERALIARLADDFMEKPFELDQVKGIAERMFGGSKYEA